MTRGPLLVRAGLALGLAAGIAWALTHRQVFEAGAITSALNSLGVWAPAGFIALYAVGTVLFFPARLAMTPRYPISSATGIFGVTPAGRCGQ
jgi:uncharacterized membrane protein YdjX (TVP38/TMEM64 family)